MMTPFTDSLDELIAVAGSTKDLAGTVEQVGAKIVAALHNGQKLLTCGNGGSAADALHLAEELVGKYSRERKALPAICLNADVTALTCIGNDYGYRQVFARQVEALGKAGDILVGFSTSGNSENIEAAFAAAREKGVLTVLLSGKSGGRMKGTCHYELIVPSNNTARIQEIHTVILHQWLEYIDAENWDK